jgi:hypothetical protein
MTLEWAKKWVIENRGTGVNCPCCDQFVKIYRRKVTSSMAMVLVAMYHQFKTMPPTVFLDVPDWMSKTVAHRYPAATRGGDYAKLRYWGLIETQPGMLRPDGSGRTGLWRITDYGNKFVRREATIWCAAYTCNDSFLGYDTSKAIYIESCLGKKFDYSELMESVQWP